MAFFEINIHFACMHKQPRFAPKQTAARIDYLRLGCGLVDNEGTHNVKILAEKRTKMELASWPVYQFVC